MPIESGTPAQVTGVLGYDAIEGGCLYVETGTGTRFELLLPTAWRMDPATERIGGPGGVRVSAGDRVTVTGAVTDAIATVCQVGPVFRVTGIVPVH